MRITRDLPDGRTQVGDRHLKFHGTRDNLIRRGGRLLPRALREAGKIRMFLIPSVGALALWFAIAIVAALTVLRAEGLLVVGLDSIELQSVVHDATPLPL